MQKNAEKKQGVGVWWHCIPDEAELIAETDERSGDAASEEAADTDGMGAGAVEAGTDDDDGVGAAAEREGWQKRCPPMKPHSSK